MFGCRTLPYKGTLFDMEFHCKDLIGPKNRSYCDGNVISRITYILFFSIVTNGVCSRK